MKLYTNAKRSRRRGAALVEYGLLVAGIAVVSLAAVAVLGNKIGDLFATSAVVLPGAHEDDNKPIATGQAISTDNTGTEITIQSDPSKMSTLGEGLGLDQGALDALVIDKSNPDSGGE